MAKEIVISERENIAATFENGKILEFFMNEGEQLVGDILLGKVDSIIQSIDAAFVSIGKNRNGFIHVTDLTIKDVKRKINIKNYLRPKQNILVQIAKEATGTKGPRLTGMLTIPGKYMVLTPYERKVGISKKITDSFERDRLIYISKKICQSGYGIIVRTEAMGQSEEALKEDLDYLLKRWHEILKMSETANAPAVLYRDQDLLYRVLRDGITTEVDKITVDTLETRDRAVELLQSWSHNAFRFVHLSKNPMPLSHQYSLFGELEKALQTRVALPSGGYLIIEKTEALTVIDINSGNTRGTSGLSETILQTNKEAAVEIAIQLRLRDIGGVIVIDFIDMIDPREQQIVWQLLAQSVKEDKAQPQIGYFSEFSLLEMTRHRQKKSLSELLTSSCPYCDGVGRIRNSVYRSDLLSNESIRKRASNFGPSTSVEASNSRVLEEITSSVDYVEDKMINVPRQVREYKQENDHTQISYPKYDRNNNNYDHEHKSEITQELNDNYEHDVAQSSAVSYENNDSNLETNEKEHFVVELTDEERQYIESIEEPTDRGHRNNRFNKNKKEFVKKPPYDRNNRQPHHQRQNNDSVDSRPQHEPRESNVNQNMPHKFAEPVRRDSIRTEVEIDNRDRSNENTHSEPRNNFNNRNRHQNDNRHPNHNRHNAVNREQQSDVFVNHEEQQHVQVENVVDHQNVIEQVSEVKNHEPVIVEAPILTPEPAVLDLIDLSETA